MSSYRNVYRRTETEARAQRQGKRSVELVEVDYRQLQARAKELGIPGNQSKDDLAKAIAEAESE